jgi:hypothetical protein
MKFNNVLRISGLGVEAGTAVVMAEEWLYR